MNLKNVTWKAILIDVLLIPFNSLWKPAKRIFFFEFVIVLLAGAFASAGQNMALLLESDPESFFEVRNNDAFHRALGNQMTAEAWIYAKDLTGLRVIANKEESFQFAVRGGTFNAALRPDPRGLGWAWFNSKFEIELEKWAHVAMIWDGEHVRMYVDGRESEPFLKKADAINVTKATFKVGRRERGGATHGIFDGLIDEVRISKVVRYQDGYEVPRSAFEPDDDTLALYHFDKEEPARMIEDFSQSGADGKLKGQAKLVPSTAPTALPVEAGGKLATLWGTLKAH